jgi:hypothetical protein
LWANCGEASVAASTWLPLKVRPATFTITGVMSASIVVEHLDPVQLFGSDPTML